MFSKWADLAFCMGARNQDSVTLLKLAVLSQLLFTMECLTWLRLFLHKPPSAHFILILMGWELFTVIMGYIVKRPWCSGLFYWLPCLWVFPAASAVLCLAFTCAVFYMLRSCVVLSASAGSGKMAKVVIHLFPVQGQSRAKCTGKVR